MGVTGLWKLIEATGKPVPLETLENKVLAIDISIWLHQVVKGYQDSKGGHLQNAHLLGLFNRICKLLYFRIKPIFIFDGRSCALKQETIRKRAQSKSKLHSEAEKLEQLLLQSLAKEKIVKEALGAELSESLSPIKIIQKLAKQSNKDELFKLPDIDEKAGVPFKLEVDEVEACPKKGYNVNIDKIDVTNPSFKSLPADIRHDILTDIKDTRKQTSWAKLRELPEESTDFSSYQMKGLLKRRQVQVSLEEAEKEMGGKVFSLSELESLLSEDGVLEFDSKYAQKIAANENTRFLYVRDIAKAVSEAKTEPQPSTSKGITSNEEDEYDLDLQRAIAMSLEDDNDSDVDESKSDGPRKLNAQQRKNLGSTVHGLVRGFMMEYAEMNDDDLNDMLEATQVSQVSDDLNDSLSQKFPNTDRYVLYGTPKKKQSLSSEDLTKEDQAESSSVIDISEEEESKSPEKKSEKVITIEANINAYKREEDLFADIFQEQGSPKSLPDVEVASIASDDTIEYDYSENNFNRVENTKESESGFVSEDGKKSEEESFQKQLIAIETKESEKVEKFISESVKFWGNLEDVAVVENSKSTPKKSENEKFYEIFNSPSPSKKFEKLSSSPSILKTPEKLKSPEKITTLPVLNTPEKQNVSQEKIKSPSSVASLEKVSEDKTPITPAKSQILSEEEEIAEINEIFADIQDFSDEEPKISLKDEIAKSAQILRDTNTEKELLKLQENVQKDLENYSLERNKLNRMGASITQMMSNDCKDLLKLFGIPYINSPSEAEAQCAFLNAISMIDGIITDDSDVWLFGAQTVYKNFFVQKKMVMEFKIQNIEEMLHLDRHKLVQLAMLVGSDYTMGLNGVGAVTALEILAAFPPTPMNEGETDTYQSLLSSLRKFREWFTSGKQQTSGGKSVLKSKLKNVELLEGFPSVNVMRAYLEPQVDDSTEPFTWGTPDVESLVEFARVKLGWTRMKTDEILQPVLKRLNEKKQTTIRDYFKSQMKKMCFDNQKLSKRVQKAVHRMGGGENAVEEEAEKNKKPRKRAANKGKSKKAFNEADFPVLVLSDDESDEPVEKKADLGECSKDVLKIEENSIKNEESKATEEESKKQDHDVSKLLKLPKKSATPAIKRATRKRKPKELEAGTSSQDASPIKRAPRIPETKQIIPQRERDKIEQEQKKQKAIEIFNKKKNQKKD